MDAIEREIAERKTLIQQWADEIESLVSSKVALSERAAMEIDHQITKLRYKMGSAEWVLKDLEEIAAEKASPKRERPPLPKARRLSVVERQRIEQHERAKVIAELEPDCTIEIHVHVGRLTDERGNPQISVQIGPRRRLEDEF